ncbi:adaptive-response sensory-kinase SasA [Rhodoferax lithotrophicus]|uniref:histidine kinase n=1 Tax=Rhodoferax lithotrophicus TaxID=2798804 RepID=A0ABN6DBF2_9BURK|nr:ATP-binding protein [Rhodoferax sp. MIZ03]BCO29073.1 adaptive-response sensory-kinase SasA [Rhodoferax sp. MIZ03]
MSAPPEASSWFGPTLLEPGLTSTTTPQEFERLWRAFMTARATLGLVLVLLQGGFYFVASQQNTTALLICSTYFVAALAVRLISHPHHLGHTFDAQWLRTVGVDLLAFSALQAVQNNNINYTPLLALPVLMASILGSLIMSMGTAAGVTLLLFTYAFWTTLQTSSDATAHFMQAALTGSGCFAISFIANQFATRLASVELRAQRSQLAVTIQRQVNELVIATLSDGILVVDEQLWVRSANPAAFTLLGLSPQPPDSLWPLTGQAGWQDLLDLVILSHSTQQDQLANVRIHQEGQGPRHLRVRTQITPPLQAQTSSLCVVFMQDQREMQARVRTEKLASMGRMSAAVAHEIRNPLAAIIQANALLSEDLKEPSHLRMTQMVNQNALRLEKIVQNVLNLAHAPHHPEVATGQMLDLAEDAPRICRDWQHQNAVTQALTTNWPATVVLVWFDADHLRRILVNLLDNAKRFSSGQENSIQVGIQKSHQRPRQTNISLTVWSDGGPLEPSVEQHLFEPFFSSDSRSSGLGLYICRELCESHGASMSYERNNRIIGKKMQSGNEFSVLFCTQPPGVPPTGTMPPSP